MPRVWSGFFWLLNSRPPSASTSCLFSTALTYAKPKKVLASISCSLTRRFRGYALYLPGNVSLSLSAGANTGLLMLGEVTVDSQLWKHTSALVMNEQTGRRITETTALALKSLSAGRRSGAAARRVLYWASEIKTAGAHLITENRKTHTKVFSVAGAEVRANS